MAIPSNQDIGIAIPAQDIIPRAAVHRFVPTLPRQDVVAIARVHGVVIAARVHPVAVVPAPDLVVPTTAPQRVVARAAVDEVPSGSTVDLVVARIAVEVVGLPRCGTVLPAIRRPANVRQFMWGGWTCKQCSAEFDKWGQVLEP
jgi:hypothetical protein